MLHAVPGLQARQHPQQPQQQPAIYSLTENVGEFPKAQPGAHGSGNIDWYEDGKKTWSAPMPQAVLKHWSD